MHCMRTRCLSGLLLLLLAYWLSSGNNASARPAVTCLPHEVGQAELRTIRANFYSVTGRLGGFDPCDRSVRFRIPEGIGKPPLMISVHGGGGISDVLNSNEVFHQQGFATLAFDAYSMQGIKGRDSRFWAFSVSNEARQRMIYSTALAAYRWALQREDIDTSRIYLFGISNGATVVANLAGVVSPEHVKGIIAEGITPIGIGLPDEIKVPVLLAFGNLDNFGNRDPNGKRWALTGPCSHNILFPEAPVGSSRYCSGIGSGGQTPSPLQWAESVKKSGGKIEIAYFDNMAHAAFLGPLNLGQNTWSSGETFGSSTGASDAARAEFLKAMLDFIDRNK